MISMPRFSVRRHHVLVTGATLTLLLNLAGCAKSYVLRPGERTPASVGTIKTSADRNDNTVVNVKLKHLAPPMMLNPALTTYVVWLRPVAGNDFTNIGQLAMTDDRSGELTATTPFPEFDVIVTAEASGTTQRPSEYVVLRGHATRP